MSDATGAVRGFISGLDAVGLSAAGPDGIRWPAPHFSLELKALGAIQV